MKSAVFLERDGILNLESSQGRGAPLTRREFVVNEDAIGPLRRLKAAGLVLLVVTNQPGISRGILSRRELECMHDTLRRTFPLDGILVCPHEEMDGCSCRKPRPGLLLEASFRWHLDLERSFVISDKWQDAQAAHRAGCLSFLVKSPRNGRGHYDFVVPNLQAAVEKVLQFYPSPKSIEASPRPSSS